MSAASTGSAARGWLRRPEHLLILSIALLYLAIIGRYRAFDLDNVWFLSFSHSYWVQHIPTDTFRLQAFPAGMGGVVAFGKLAAAVQGAVLSVFGWSLGAATLISIIFVVAALLLLADMCRRLGYSQHFTLCFIAFVGLMEPFVNASQKTRYEFLPVFLLALALWLASRRFVLLAAFFAALAVEVEPVAAVIPVAVAVTLLVQGRADGSTARRIPRILLGTVAALALYLLLHPNILTILRTADMHTAGRRAFPGGFIPAYFVIYKRHLVDLAILIAAFVVAFRKHRNLLTDWPALSLLAICIASALLRWANETYFSFVVPFTGLFVMQALSSEKRWRCILVAISLIALPQYAYRAYFWTVRFPGFTQRDQRQISEAIDRSAARLGKPSSQLNILGNFSTWYAHPDRFIDLDIRNVTPSLLQHADLLLCFDAKLDPVLPVWGNPEIACSDLSGFTRPVETMVLHGHLLQILTPTGVPATMPPMPRPPFPLRQPTLKQ